MIPVTPLYSFATRGDTLLAGAHGVVYISADGGRTWQASNPIDDDITSVDALLLHEGTIYAGCYNHGIFTSFALVHLQRRSSLLARPVG